MYRDRNKSSGSGSSTKGDEVEIVSKFLAPLCDRDETARNIALAAAQTTVEGWLGGVAEPNHCQEEIERMKNSRDEQIVKFKGQNGRYDMSIERTPTKIDEKYQNDNQRYQINQVKNIHDNFGTESFFPQSVTEHLAFPCDSSSNLDCIDKYHLESFDCVDGRTSNSNTLPSSTNKDRRHIMDRVVDNVAPSNTTSFDEAKGLKIENRGKRFNRDNDTRFSSSGDSERKLLYYSSSDKINELQQTTSDDTKHRFFRNKGARQKQLDDDDLDSDTRLYGKSPKFDDNMGNFGYFESNYRSYLSSSEPGRRSIDQGMSGYFFDFDETSLNDDQSTKTKTTTTNNPDGVVFNTLDGFENDYMIASYDEVLETINLECTNPSNDKIIEPSRCYESSFQDHYLRNNDDRKFTAGQTKRPLSQDEDVSSKNGRLLKGPEVTPGDVGRMLNLGNALDGPRQQTQPNKYLSLVTMHLPVILRLSVNCPFQNVRIKCSEILQLVKDRGLPVPVPTFDGPSTFVPTSEVSFTLTNIHATVFPLLIEFHFTKESKNSETKKIIHLPHTFKCNNTFCSVKLNLKNI
ncbi:uncharacterized protein LOC122854454 [Aphidius gifuensis]|uniref:uncharacterized protein LOC122854454 n=1 Tax=Aphidius gifuensis TaxID=684658 RepID=UPI001CDC8AE2|nr:uncharacterized protein LOC122854454 [Aphidius gifuensis]